MNKGFYAKFLCPTCHKKFRQKIWLPKDGSTVTILGEDLAFEYHVHCPRCEEYIPVDARLNK